MGQASVNEISELQSPVYNEPMDDGLFEPPVLEFRNQADILPGPFSSLDEAAEKLPFPLHAPNPMVAGMEVLIVIELLGPWAAVMLRKGPSIVLTEKPVRGVTEPLFEERTSRSGVPWFYARERRGDVEVEVESALSEHDTRQLISRLQPVPRK